jgi:hypothetical protein
VTRRLPFVWTPAEPALVDTLATCLLDQHPVIVTEEISWLIDDLAPDTDHANFADARGAGTGDDSADE